MSFEKQHAGDGTAPERVTSREVLEYATIEGARTDGVAHEAGSLTPSKKAYVIMLRTDKPNVFPINDPIGAVVWGMDTSNADSVFVGVGALKRIGQLLHVNWEAVKSAVADSREYVLKKSGLKLSQI